MPVSRPPERILIADDEPTARRWLRDLLARESDLSLVAECADGESAAAEIERLRPDLVFLDVEMPGMPGIEVVRRIGVERMPPTVFVTAHDRYAAEAFEVDGIDFLLKPFGVERLRARTLAKAPILGRPGRFRRAPATPAGRARRLRRAAHRRRTQQAGCSFAPGRRAAVRARRRHRLHRGRP